MIKDLPEDVYVEVCRYLGGRDTLSLSKTCRDLRGKAQTVWDQATKPEILRLYPEKVQKLFLGAQCSPAVMRSVEEGLSRRIELSVRVNRAPIEALAFRVADRALQKATARDSVGDSLMTLGDGLKIALHIAGQAGKRYVISIAPVPPFAAAPEGIRFAIPPELPLNALYHVQHRKQNPGPRHACNSCSLYNSDGLLTETGTSFLKTILQGQNEWVELDSSSSAGEPGAPWFPFKYRLAARIVLPFSEYWFNRSASDRSILERMALAGLATITAMGAMLSEPESPTNTLFQEKIDLLFNSN